MVSNTFYEDFTIADLFGASAIKDTYRRAFAGWKDDVEMITALTIVLNNKIFEHYFSGNETYARLYDDLWGKCDSWCCNNLKGEDLRYFFRETD